MLLIQFWNCVSEICICINCKLVRPVSGSHTRHLDSDLDIIKAWEILAWCQISHLLWKWSLWLCLHDFTHTFHLRGVIHRLHTLSPLSHAPSLPQITFVIPCAAQVLALYKESLTLPIWGDCFHLSVLTSDAHEPSTCVLSCILLIVFSTALLGS